MDHWLQDILLQGQLPGQQPTLGNTLAIDMEHLASLDQVLKLLPGTGAVPGKQPPWTQNQSRQTLVKVRAIINPLETGKNSLGEHRHF